MNTEINHRFLRACFRQPIDQTPIWIMRQAGRYLPQYRKTRSEAGDFLSLCRNTNLAAEVTMQPIDFLNVDAAILFSDILVIPEAMGVKLRFVENEGPILEPPLRDEKDIRGLQRFDPNVQLGYVMSIIEEIQHRLAGRVPLIGFSGSPWTLATYMVEGGSSRDFSRVKTMMYNEPRLMNELLKRIAEGVADYLNAQIEHGVQAVQIFDTWGGLLSPERFKDFSLSYITEVITKLHRTGKDGQPVPVIVFAKGCGHSLAAIAASGCDVVGLDWTTDLASARELVGDRVALQGNLDPAVLYAQPERIREEVIRLLQAFGPHAGHIFNLGHGVAQDMSPEHVKSFVQAVHEESRQMFLGRTGHE